MTEQTRLHMKEHRKIFMRDFTQEEIDNFHPPREPCITCGHKFYSRKNAFACCRTMDKSVKGW